MNRTAIALALVEHPLDMETIDKGRNPCRDLSGHRHGTDHIATAFEHRLPFGRVGGHLGQLKLGAAVLAPQRDPDTRRAVGKVIAIIRRFRAEQIDAGRTRVIRRRIALGGQHGPGRR